MFNKERVKGFLAGVCSTAVIAASCTAFAATIDVEMGGIKVFWDGVEKVLTNVKGEKVEPIIYNGTTYVPVRAMANLMGKEVDWDQSTFSVFVGGKPTAATTPLDKLDRSKINSEGAYIQTGTKATFKLKDKTIQCSNLLYGYNAYNTYVLDNNYSKLVAKAVMPYESIGSDLQNELIFYSVADDGTEYELAYYEFEQTEQPIDIEVDLRGVTNLKIKWYDEEASRDTYIEEIALYDINLLGR